MGMTVAAFKVPADQWPVGQLPKVRQRDIVKK